MNRAFLIHLFLMVLGYGLAVLVASTITVFVIFAPTVFPDNGAWGSAYKTLRELPLFLIFGAFYTAMFALPGWLMTAIAAEYRNVRGKFWFAFAGLLTAILAHSIALVFADRMFAAPLIVSGSLVGGLCGGIIYWAIVGKRSGVWKAISKHETA